MRVQMIQTGRIFFKPALVDGNTRLGALRGFFQTERVEIPMLGWLVEHPDGHVVLDTGAHHQIVHMLPRFLRRLAIFEVTTSDEIGPQMTARGLRPDDVRLVIPTHLDVDHAGGVSHFPNAQFLIHRPEHEYASTFVGKQRFAPHLWPDWFRPTLYDLDYAHSVHFHSRREAITTSKRIATFIEQTPTILVPIHDPTGSDRIAARGPIAKV